MTETLRITERLLRPIAPGRWDVFGDGERLGRVLLVQTADLGYVYRAWHADGKVPMLDGSVWATDAEGRKQSYETRDAPEFETLEDAAKCIVLGVETGRILNAQIAYERANGWSTD